MALKQSSDGRFDVRNNSDFEKALALMRERESQVAELEQMMEDEYDFISLQQEARALKFAIDAYLLAKGKNYSDDLVTMTIVQPKKWHWNGEKLRTIVGKAIYLKLVDMTPSSEKIDEAVKKGIVDRDKIDPAYEAEPISQYVKTTAKKQRPEEDDEAERVKEAMGG
jgi:hypothetical protein